MIFDLCQFVQKFLHKHNTPPSRSFYDEMISNRKKQEEKMAIEEQKKRDMLKKKEEKKVSNTNKLNPRLDQIILF